MSEEEKQLNSCLAGKASVKRAIDVRIDGVFEGPLDLLLHLVRKHELDVWNLPMAFVCQEYLTYVKTIERIDPGQVVVWVEMAATLVAIKAKMLLPPERVDDDQNEDEEGPDPREALARSLVLRELYKEAAAKFGLLGAEWANIFRRTGGIGEAAEIEWNDELPPLNLTLEEIAMTWLAVKEKITAVTDSPPLREIAPETVRVRDRVDLLVSLFEASKDAGLEVRFDEFCNIPSPSPSLRVKIASFLAILELGRMGRVLLRQDEPFGDITIMSA